MNRYSFYLPDVLPQGALAAFESKVTHFLGLRLFPKSCSPSLFTVECDDPHEVADAAFAVCHDLTDIRFEDLATGAATLIGRNFRARRTGDDRA